MGLSWLGGKSWSDVTRDERFFCGHLYNVVQTRQNGASGFVEIINEECQLDLPLEANWEFGYEVCFYRDLMFDDVDKYDERLSLKRTFDLCLFSDRMIVIIEAKAYQTFDGKQTEEFVKDKECIEKILGIPVSVILIPLASSLYKATFNNSTVKANFNCNLLTWDALANKYGNGSPDPIMARADMIFSLRPKSSDSTKKFLSGAELIRLFDAREVAPAKFWVGRSNGIQGLNQDLKSDAWLDRVYEVNTEAAKAPNRNWFSLEEFVRTVLTAPPV